jgi:rhodanese-related sulfurtransferase/DNA-binding transcriptional ArsR family regulator
MEADTMSRDQSAHATPPGHDRAAKDALNEQFARVGHALANGRRVELLDLLAQGERSVEALAEEAEIGITVASAHLQVLRRAGLVETRRSGTRIFYRLAGDDVYRLLAAVRELARTRLAEAERAARAYLGEPDALEPLSREELLRRVAAGDVVVVDVRPAAEYSAGHIANAISVPLDQLEARLAELPVEREVVAYCRGPFCALGPQGVALLRRHGHPARRLEEGFPEWRLAGLPVASGAADEPSS